MTKSLECLLSVALVFGSGFAGIGCASSPSSSTPTTAASAVDISGGWQSACAPMSSTQGFSLDFTIAAKTWGVDYVVFADTSCTTKFATVHIEGPYEIDEVSPLVASAHDARFGFTKKTLTPHSAAAAGFLASDAGCKQAGFAEGTATDISTTGCAGLGQRPIAQCGADYNLVKVENDALTFGNRPADNDMCTPEKRPTSLSTLSSKRK